jgi:DNA-binding PadR family transcriptional regulator
MRPPGNSTYALLGLLAIRSWSGYELTQQARRSLRYVWPSSEAHLYREQRRLVELGWAQAQDESAAGRSRKRYRVTPAGRDALREWLATPPAAPVLEIEGALRMFFSDQGSTEDLLQSLRSTGRDSALVITELATFAEEYLHDRAPFPERLHVIALAMEMLTRTYAQLSEACSDAASEVERWDQTKGLGMNSDTRHRFEEVVARRDKESQRWR